jgi:Uma2 family endonuclease
MANSDIARIVLRYEVSTRDWTLPEEPVPESQPHDLAVDLVKAILLHWVATTARNAQVARNLAVRWDAQRPQTGTDPDLCVIEPRTPEGDDLTSLCTWRPGHASPKLAIEVVSESNTVKDYVAAPERYAACGVDELWIFDPKLVGSARFGGPQRIQVWRRADDGAFERVYAGEGPAWSPYVAGWLFAVDEGRKLRIAGDREGTVWWPTGEEAERAAKEAERTAKEAERAAKEAERAAKEAALARVAELEAKLAGRG